MKHVLLVQMRYDYTDPFRGIAYEEKHIHQGLRAYYPELRFSHFDFVRQGNRWGLEAMSTMLVETVDRLRPDLVLCCFADARFDPLPEAIATIGQTTRTALWLADDHWRYEKYSRAWAPHFHYMITTDKQAVSKYHRDGFGHKVIKSNWAVNHHLFRPLQPEQDRQVTFVGQPHSNRATLVQQIHQAGVPVEVYGPGWHAASRLPFHEMVRMYGRSRISLNLSNASTNDIQQIKGRTFEIPACGGFMLTGGAEDLESYYEPDREMVVYEDEADMIDKIRFYLAHETVRRTIQERGYRRTLAEHTWKHRFDAIFRQLGILAG